MRRSTLSTILLTLAALAAASLACAQAPETAALESEEDKTLYALGLALAKNLEPFDLSEADLAKIKAGLSDGVLGEPKVDLQSWGPKIQGLAQERAARVKEKELEHGREFQARALAEAGAVKTESGLIYREIAPGDGASPAASDTVRLHYHGTLHDGSVFDSSRDVPDPKPVSFSLARVIPCFTEGVSKMKVGGKAQLTCPPEIAYGDSGAPPAIPPGATIAFEVELIGIGEETPAEEAP